MIAYAFAGSPPGFVIHIMALDGSGDRALTAGNLPAWSPDGKAIVYVTPNTMGCG
jgi:hypothetical protein